LVQIVNIILVSFNCLTFTLMACRYGSSWQNYLVLTYKQINMEELTTICNVREKK